MEFLLKRLLVVPKKVVIYAGHVSVYTSCSTAELPVVVVVDTVAVVPEGAEKK